ncbi:MAG: 5'/3'-nucleotidase SurE [Anaerolineae bacterium]|nr:5'/3'-nucleotidase SurE [Anaerolineae bacterium]
MGFLPLILVTNDDGITSSGLWAAVEAVLPLGKVLVVAPNRQWSGAGRSMPHNVTGSIEEASREINGQYVEAYAVDASPALAVGHAILEIAQRKPDLVVSGINFGANLSIEVTISGTVGAALEAGAFGIPAIAVSQEMNPVYHLTGSERVDYAPAQLYTYRFAQYLLEVGLPYGADALNVNIPDGATLNTPWRYTRLSRHRYYVPLPPNRILGEGRPGYKIIEDLTATEVDSDIRTIMADRMVSATLLSLDMTAQVISAYSFNCGLTEALRESQEYSIPSPLQVKTPVPSMA